MKNIWKYILPLIIGFVIGILINIPSCLSNPEPEVIYKEVHDTITIKKDSIIYKTRPVNVYLHDTLYVNKDGDTIKLDDLPVTEYEYNDTINTDSTSTEIKINYHGFDAGIDNINLIHNYFEKQTIIVKEPKKVGVVWFVGVYAGYGVHGSMNTGTFGHGPEVGIGAGIGIGGRIK